MNSLPQESLQFRSEGPARSTDSREAVVLLHGLGLPGWSMLRMQRAFERQGYRAIRESYPSRSMPIERLRDEWLPDLLRRYRTETASSLHFVTHSMGGIVVRAFLAEPSRVPANMGRVVMLAPPHHGSVVVDHMRDWWVFRLFTGVNGRRLGTEPESFPNSLPPWDPAIDLGIVAGDRNYNPIYGRWQGVPSDGQVSIESSRLPGMRGHIVVHHTHDLMQLRAAPIRQAVEFVRSGKFFGSVKSEK